MPVYVQLNPGEVSEQTRELLEDATSDLTPLMEDIGEHMLLSIDDNFVNEQSPDGEDWAPLSPSRLAAETRSDKILQESGTRGGLRGTIVYEAHERDLELGSNKIYSRVMQEGAKKGEFGKMSNGRPIPWGDIPAREYLGVSEDDRTAIAEIITNHFANL